MNSPTQRVQSQSFPTLSDDLHQLTFRITDLSVKNQILLQVYVADAYFESQQYKQSAKVCENLLFTFTSSSFQFYARVLPLYDRLPKDLAKVSRFSATCK